LKSLKEYVENKKQKRQNRNIGRVKIV
jgi:hypothetical protein